MSTAAAHRTGPAPALRADRVARAGASTDMVALGTVLAFAVVLAALTWGRWGDLTMDTGYDLVAASRTAHGQLPYIDYDYFYGPAGPLLLGGLYAITGTALWPAVLLGFAIALAAIVLTFRLAREFSGPVPSALAAALVATGALSSANNSYILPHSTSGPLVTVFVLGAVLCLIRSARGQVSTGQQAAAGALVGLTLLTRPEIAVPFTFAVAVWLGLRVLAAGDDRRLAVREAAVVLGSAAALATVVYGAFLTSVSPHDLVLSNLYPQNYVRAAGHVVLDAHAPKTAGSIAELVGRLALYAAATGALLVAAHALSGGGRRRTAAVGAVGGAVLFFVAVLLSRPETVRYYLEFAYGWIPAGAWIGASFVGWRLRAAPAGARRHQDWVALLVGLVLASTIASTYASFNPFPNALHPEATPYLLPLVGAFLVWLHVTALGGQARGTSGRLGVGLIVALLVANGVLMLRDARAETVTVRGPHGSLTARPAEGAALQGVLDAIGRETRPGDRILLAPQLTTLYVMSGRVTPLREISLLPGTLDRPAEDAAIKQLRGVRLVAIDRTPLTAYAHGAFGTTFDRRLSDAVHRDFRRVTSFSGVGPSARHIDLYVKDPS